MSNDNKSGTNDAVNSIDQTPSHSSKKSGNGNLNESVTHVKTGPIGLESNKGEITISEQKDLKEKSGSQASK